MLSDRGYCFATAREGWKNRFSHCWPLYREGILVNIMSVWECRLPQMTSLISPLWEGIGCLMTDLHIASFDTMESCLVNAKWWRKSWVSTRPLLIQPQWERKGVSHYYLWEWKFRIPMWSSLIPCVWDTHYHPVGIKILDPHSFSDTTLVKCGMLHHSVERMGL